MPSFFKVWFTFVACFILIVFGGIFFIGYKVSTTSPEEAGRIIGIVIKSIEEGRKEGRKEEPKKDQNE